MTCYLHGDCYQDFQKLPEVVLDKMKETAEEVMQETTVDEVDELTDKGVVK